jgi:hypothetical protein
LCFRRANVRVRSAIPAGVSGWPTAWPRIPDGDRLQFIPARRPLGSTLCRPPGAARLWQSF